MSINNLKQRKKEYHDEVSMVSIKGKYKDIMRRKKQKYMQLLYEILDLYDQSDDISINIGEKNMQLRCRICNHEKYVIRDLKELGLKVTRNKSKYKNTKDYFYIRPFEFEIKENY